MDLGAGVSWGLGTNHPLLRKQNIKKMKQIVNIMVEIEDSKLNRYLIVIFTFWHRLSDVILLSPLLFNVNVMVYSTAVPLCLIV